MQPIEFKGRELAQLDDVKRYVNSLLCVLFSKALYASNYEGIAPSTFGDYIQGHIRGAARQLQSLEKLLQSSFTESREMKWLPGIRELSRYIRTVNLRGQNLSEVLAARDVVAQKIVNVLDENALLKWVDGVSNIHELYAKLEEMGYPYSVFYELDDGVKADHFFPSSAYPQHTYVVTAKPNSYSLEIVSADSIGEKSAYAKDILKARGDALAFFNGGYFQLWPNSTGELEIGTPEGLAIIKGRKIHDMAGRGSGVLWIDNKGYAHIAHKENFVESRASHALQVELLSLNNTEYDINAETGKYPRPRNVIGLTEDQSLVMCIYKQGTFRQAEQFLKTYHQCNVVAALDGGLSAQAADRKGGSSLIETDVDKGLPESAVANFVVLKPHFNLEQELLQ